jgi:hypothetical protein
MDRLRRIDNRNLTVLATTKKGWLSADDTTIAPVGAAATCWLPVATLRLATAFQGDDFRRHHRPGQRIGGSDSRPHAGNIVDRAISEVA